MESSGRVIIPDRQGRVSGSVGLDFNQEELLSKQVVLSGDPAERGVIAVVQDVVQEYWETSQVTAKLVSPDSHEGTLCRVSCCTATAQAGGESTSTAKRVQLCGLSFWGWFESDGKTASCH